MSESSHRDGTGVGVAYAQAEGGSVVDERMVNAWCAWLGRLATDAEAALAAALAYRQLDDGGRDEWLTALEQDAVNVPVPRIAVYAPLLAVEADAKRRERIVDAIGPAAADASPRVGLRALHGVARDRTRVAAIVSPLYLNFVQVLACGYRSGKGFDWVKHDPIVDERRAPTAGDHLGNAVLEAIPLKSLVDDLALTVVAQVRDGGTVPEALRVFADLFGPNAEEELLPGSAVK